MEGRAMADTFRKQKYGQLVSKMKWEGWWAFWGGIFYWVLYDGYLFGVMELKQKWVTYRSTLPKYEIPKYSSTKAPCFHPIPADPQPASPFVFFGFSKNTKTGRVRYEKGVNQDGINPSYFQP